MVSEELHEVKNCGHTELKGVDGFGIDIDRIGLAGEFGCECHSGVLGARPESGKRRELRQEIDAKHSTRREGAARGRHTLRGGGVGQWISRVM